MITDMGLIIVINQIGQFFDQSDDSITFKKKKVSQSY
jgi:hypothetical protein